MEAVLKEVGVWRRSQAQRAVLVGQMLAPGQVHEKPTAQKVHTIWGEMAWQLGGPRDSHDRRCRIRPAERVLARR